MKAMRLLGLAHDAAGRQVTLTDRLVALLPDEHKRFDFIMSVEEAFGIDIPDAGESFDTVGDLLEFIERKAA